MDEQTPGPRVIPRNPGKPKEYNDGNLPGMVFAIAEELARLGEYKPDVVYLQKFLEDKYPEVKNKAECPNCQASMLQAIYTLDCLDALLLLQMAQHVRQRRGQFLDFTLANQVHIPTLPTTDAIRHRTTMCSKLGLVAPLLDNRRRHVRGVWVITARGWAFLRGEPVPKYVQVFRNEIKERFDETITLSEARQIHADKIEKIKAQNRLPASDYRLIFSNYNPDEWVEYGQPHNGVLL